MPLYVVSACLAGTCCRYDGSHALCGPVVKLVQEGRALALCPEVLANLPTPREPVEMLSGVICDAYGYDYTKEFLTGAKKALELSLEAGCSRAILKSRSPSCGRDSVYDGTFSKTLVQGQGVWARLLFDHGFQIYTEEDLPKCI